MFDPQFIRSGFIKGEKFQNYMKSHLKVSRFEELKIPLKIVATDYWKKEAVIFEKGDLGQNTSRSHQKRKDKNTPGSCQLPFRGWGIKKPLPIPAKAQIRHLIC